jgi:hypothetical protein
MSCPQITGLPKNNYDDHLMSIGNLCFACGLALSQILTWQQNMFSIWKWGQIITRQVTEIFQTTPKQDQIADGNMLVLICGVPYIYLNIINGGTPIAGSWRVCNVKKTLTILKPGMKTATIVYVITC